MYIIDIHVFEFHSIYYVCNWLSFYFNLIDGAKPTASLELCIYTNLL